MTQPSAPAEVGPAPLSETKEVQAPPSAPPSKREPVPETSLAEIGWDSLSRPTKLARKENREALALHRAGKYAEAQAGFARAVEASPGHDLARFNLACAYARLGKLDEAATELTTLLERDLLRFQSRWRGDDADPDLDALRDSKHAAILDERIETLRVAYDEAHDIGIPAYAYRYRPLHTKKRSKEAGGTDGETLMAGGMDWLVAGIYLPQAKRFVPLTRDGTLAWLDLPNRRVVHISSGWVMGWHGEVPYDPSLSIRSTAPNPAEQTATVSVDVDSQFLGLGDEKLYASHELAWLDEGLAVFVSHDLNAYGGSTRLITSDGVESIHRRALKSKERMHLLLEGSVLTTPDASFKHTFAISNLDSPDGKYRVRIRTSIAEHGEFSPKPPRTVVHRIDKDTGQSEIISEGKGPGWALFGPRGALFVETGGSVRRWSDAADDSPEATLEGLHLTMPIPTQPCDSCG